MTKLIPSIAYSFLILSVFLFISLTGCDTSEITEPEDVELLNSSAVQGLSADEINWISWKPELVGSLRALKKNVTGTSTKLVKWDRGGSVGGRNTFDNKVFFPRYALSQDTWVTVDVVCHDGESPCNAEVDYLPSMKFLTDVTITLSYGALDYDGDPYLLKVYYYDESTELWIEVPDPVVDTKKETLSVQVNHFTRFGWGF